MAALVDVIPDAVGDGVVGAKYELDKLLVWDGGMQLRMGKTYTSKAKAEAKTTPRKT